jgi:hypothetical protein
MKEIPSLNNMVMWSIMTFEKSVLKIKCMLWICVLIVWPYKDTQAQIKKISNERQKVVSSCHLLLGD